MRKYVEVCVEVDPYDALEELDDNEIREYLEDRGILPKINLEEFIYLNKEKALELLERMVYESTGRIVSFKDD